MFTLIMALLLFAGVFVCFKVSRSPDVTYEETKMMNKVAARILAGLGVIFLTLSCLTVVPAGHVGVVTVFGDVQDRALSEGINLKAPWAAVHKMSIRSQEFGVSMNASTRTGVTVDVDMVVVYKLMPSHATDIYQNVGPDYVDILVTPPINQVAKDIMVEYGPEALYTLDRSIVNERVQSALGEILLDDGIFIVRTPVQNIDLPRGLRTAIENKMEAEQDALAMEYVLQQEEREAERKRIEATGIRDFQEIVSEGISEPLIYWKYVETLESLAGSPNNTFVIVPTDVLETFPFGAN